KPDAVPDESLQRVLSAAVKLYAAKSEDRERELAPFGDRPVNATEAVTAICAIMRAADLNFFDLQMWYRRGGGGWTPQNDRGGARKAIMGGGMSEVAGG